MQCVSVIRILAPHADSCNVIVTLNLEQVASCGECHAIHSSLFYISTNRALVRSPLLFPPGPPTATDKT